MENRTDPVPKFRMGAGALILSAQKEILIVKPSYRDYWEIPGGVIEENESPLSACVREIEEELGLSMPVGRLLCLEYRNREGTSSENIHFVFDGGILSGGQVASLSLQKTELEACAFLPLAEAASKLHPRVYARVVAAVEALETGRTVYMENGMASV